MRLFSVVDVNEDSYIVPGVVHPELLKYAVSEDIEGKIDKLCGDDTLTITVATCLYSSEVINDFDLENLELKNLELKNLEPVTEDELANITDNLVALIDIGYIKIISDIDYLFEASEEDNEIIELMV